MCADLVIEPNDTFPRMKKPALIVLTLLLLLPSSLTALAEEPITISGGGWGHGIGLSQYGAKAMAENGKTATQIVQHFYTGATIGTVGQGGLVGHADPLRIGVAQDMTNIGFSPVGGLITMCLGSDCTLVANPGDGLDWSVKSDPTGQCQFYNGVTPVGSVGPCNGEITWSNQPNVRVDVPLLARTYARGKILIVPAPNNRFHMLVEIGLEEYLYGLGEMPSSWPSEALKAQAIAARSYALYKAYSYRFLSSNQPRLDSCSCHLYASTFDQKYIGWAKEAEGTNGHYGNLWRAAVDATAGKALVHTYSIGRAIQAYYFSSTGGATENNDDVWGGAAFPYLRSVSDPGATTWQTTIARSTFAYALGFDDVASAKVTGTFVSGSPSEVTVTGLKNGESISKTFTGNELRSKLGLKSHNIKSFSGFVPIPPATFSNYLSGDFDGDGKDEVVAQANSDGSVWIYNNVGGSLEGTRWALVTPGAWQKVLAGDFNGDGKTDIALFSTSGGWWVGRSTGTGFQLTKWAQFGTSTGWQTQRVGDFNGDGKDDIASFHPSNGTWWVSRSTGSSFSTELWADFTTASGWKTQIIGDYNGDGMDDIANFHPSNGTWWVTKSSGSSFSTQLWADFTTASGWQTQISGDFNGDGKDDIANFHPSNGTWWVTKSSGSSFSTQLWADFTTASGWAPQIVGDFNGDGKDDIANFHSSNGSWWTSTSSGSSFSTALKGSVSPGTGWVGQVVGDYDGDGDDDISNYYPGNLTWAIR